MKGEVSLAVELKVNISLKLIYQVIDRQKLADDVYIAIPLIALKSHNKNLKSFKLLLRRLSIGLLVVNNKSVEVILEPKPYNINLSKSRSIKKREKLISNFKNLKDNDNQGGTKGKRMTLYKEKVIQIAKVLYDNPGLSPKIIKEKTGIDNTYSILQKNYYDWFIKTAYATYELTDLGKKIIGGKNIHL